MLLDVLSVDVLELRIGHVPLGSEMLLQLGGILLRQG